MIPNIRGDIEINNNFMKKIVISPAPKDPAELV
jgi:hypothetical protein